MPVTGEFLADFDNFVKGAREADSALGRIVATSEAAGPALEDGFGGVDFDRLFKDPIGEASRAAEGMIGMFPPIVQGATMAAGAIAALGAGAFTLASRTAEVANELGGLQAKTGASIPELSKLSNAATILGTDIQALANVLFAMNRQMATKPDAFADGLRLLKINAKEFADLDFDQKLAAISTALSEQADQTVKVKAGTELLGAAYRTVADEIEDLPDALQAVADIEPFTKDDAQRAKEFQTEVALLKVELGAMGQDIGRLVIPPITTLTRYLREHADDIARTIAPKLSNLLDIVKAGAGAWERYQDGMTPAIDGTRDLTAVNAELAAGIEATNAQVPNAEAAQKALTAQLAEAKKAIAAEEAALKPFNEAMAEMASVGGQWSKTLDTINGEVVEAVKYYLEAGVAQGKLATAYALTDTQVKAIAASLKAEQEALKESTTLQADRIRALQGLYLEYDKTIRSSSATTTQTRIDDAWRAADAQIMSMAKAGTLTEEGYAVIQATAKQTADSILADTLAQDETSRTYYERLAAKAQEAYAFAKAHSAEYTAARLEQLRLEAETAAATLENWEAAADATLAGVKGAADQAAAALRAMTNAFDPGVAWPDAGEAGISRPIYATPNTTGSGLNKPPGVAGGVGFTLKPYEQVPRDLFGRPVTPGFLSGLPNVSITVQGSILSTEDQLATAVEGAVMNAYRRGGSRVPV
jgi:hypothetical protein